jgi:hypothetical protein
MTSGAKPLPQQTQGHVQQVCEEGMVLPVLLAWGVAMPLLSFVWLCFVVLLHAYSGAHAAGPEVCLLWQPGKQFLRRSLQLQALLWLMLPLLCRSPEGG